MSDDAELKQKILDTVTDLVSAFTYYDRKEDEELSREQLVSAIVTGVITIEEIVDHFRKQLSEGG